MFKYNKKDVLLLEEVYLRLRPWIKSHPNLNMYSTVEGKYCPYCGGTSLKNRGRYVTQCGIYQSFECTKCNGISRETKKTIIAAAR